MIRKARLSEMCGLGLRALRILSMVGSATVLAQAQSPQTSNPNRTVGPQSDGSIVVSDNQTLTPAGKIIELGSPVRAKSIALNPTARPIAAPCCSWDRPSRLSCSTPPPDRFSSASFLLYERRGIYIQQSGIVHRHHLFRRWQEAILQPGRQPFRHRECESANRPFDQRAERGASRAAGGRRPYYKPKAINPGGIAVSADGKRAYVVLNVANTLGVIDLAASPAKLIAQIPVGNAPNSVVIHGKYAYVSNEGGRPATSEDFTNYSDGTPIVVDRKDAFAITGTVSVVDLPAGKEIKTVKVGLHPAGMTISGSDLYVANAYSDSLSVIDLNTDKVVRTIDLSVPIAGGVFGSGPNGVAVTDDGRAYVTLGQANAVAAINLQGRDAHPVLGYIPTGYFPTSIAYDKAQKQLVVADDKGLGTHVPAHSGGLSGFSTHQDTGTVNLIPLPNASQLARFSKQVFDNNHWNLTTNIEVGPEYINAHAVPVAVPKHIGEPSLIKHVFLVIKENRTYDQMLGDVSWGNGDPSLAVFASAVPNQHALVRRFPLLDNVYAPSRQSADGHPWIGMSGSFYSNDILSPDWIRSYPGGNSNDALTYTPKGFLWTAAEAKGLTARLYGEWSKAQRSPKSRMARTIPGAISTAPRYARKAKRPNPVASFRTMPSGVTSEIPSAARIMDPHYPPFNLTIPDQYRMDYWIPEFQRLDAANQVPNLTILWLPDDHTAGTTKGQPYPINYQADNDLALGRMVDAISHSKVWAQSAIFVEEDDSQGGVDHVDGHRQPVFVISPYTVGSPGARPGQGDPYNLHRREHQSHDREHPRYATADAVRSGGIPHVRRVSKHARSDAIRPSGGGHPSRPGAKPAGR